MTKIFFTISMNVELTSQWTFYNSAPPSTTHARTKTSDEGLILSNSKFRRVDFVGFRCNPSLKVTVGLGVISKSKYFIAFSPDLHIERVVPVNPSDSLQQICVISFDTLHPNVLLARFIHCILTRCALCIVALRIRFTTSC